MLPLKNPQILIRSVRRFHYIVKFDAPNSGAVASYRLLPDSVTPINFPLIEKFVRYPRRFCAGRVLFYRSFASNFSISRVPPILSQEFIDTFPLKIGNFEAQLLREEVAN